MKIQMLRWAEAPDALKALRHRVFVHEQKVPVELEWDEHDDIAEHYLLTDEPLTDDLSSGDRLGDGDGRALGVARLFADADVPDMAHIGRMAVDPELRGQGLGSRLLSHMMAEAGKRYRILTLNAQEHAVDFYRRHGFHVASESFMEAGIPHREMQCFAPTLPGTLEAGESPFPLQLAQDETTWTFENEKIWVDLIRSLVAQARQRVRIYDHHLLHSLYDDPFLADQLSALARRNRKTGVQILIHDDRPLVERRHRLVELMHRLPSSITLKLVNTSYPSEDGAFVLVDGQGVLYRNQAREMSGFGRFRAAGRVRVLQESFQRMWDYGRTSLELRRMPL